MSAPLALRAASAMDVLGPALRRSCGDSGNGTSERPAARGAAGRNGGRYFVSAICFSSTAYLAPYLSRTGCVAL